MTAACQASLSLTISWSLSKLMSIASVMPTSLLILWYLLLLLLSIFSSIRDFSSESAVHIRWPKYWSFSFSISPSNEYSGLISPKTDQFDLLVKSLLDKGLSGAFSGNTFKGCATSVYWYTCYTVSKTVNQNKRKSIMYTWPDLHEIFTSLLKHFVQMFYL